MSETDAPKIRQPSDRCSHAAISWARQPSPKQLTATPSAAYSHAFRSLQPSATPTVARRRACRTNSAKQWVSRRQSVGSIKAEAGLYAFALGKGVVDALCRTRCANMIETEHGWHVTPSPFVSSAGTSGFEQLEQARLELSRAEEERRVLRARAPLAEERVARVSGLNEQRTAVEAKLSTQQELHQARAELEEAGERYDFLREAKGAVRHELQRAQAQVAELRAEKHGLLALGERLAEERRREASSLERRAAGAELRGRQLVREVDELSAAREAARSALLRSDAALRHAEERLSTGEAEWRGAAQRCDAAEGELRRAQGERGGATARADAAEARLAAAGREAEARRAEAARRVREEDNALAEIERLRTEAGATCAEADALLARAAFAEERWAAVLCERDVAREEARRTAERLGALGLALATSEARAVAAEDRAVNEEFRARADAAGLERAIVNAAYFKRPACVAGAHCLTCGVCHAERNSEFAPLELVTRRSPSWSLAGCVAPLERGALSQPCGTAHAQAGGESEREA